MNSAGRREGRIHPARAGPHPRLAELRLATVQREIVPFVGCGLRSGADGLVGYAWQSPRGPGRGGTVTNPDDGRP